MGYGWLCFTVLERWQTDNETPLHFTMPGPGSNSSLVTIDESQRQRLRYRLMSKLRNTAQELKDRLGDEAVSVITYYDTMEPAANNLPSIKVVGSPVLTSIIKKHKHSIQEEIHDADKSTHSSRPVLCGLPLPLINGRVSTVDKLRCRELKSLIPLLLKKSSGHSRVNWNSEEHLPNWWPPDVPWGNVKSDTRPEGQRGEETWACVLRRVAKACYTYHAIVIT